MCDRARMIRNLLPKRKHTKRKSTHGAPIRRRPRPNKRRGVDVLDSVARLLAARLNPLGRP